MTKKPDRLTKTGARHVWLTTPLKRVFAAVILVIAALSFLILWDADLLWSAREASVGPASGIEVAVANPASVSCAEKGGSSEIRNNPRGQMGYCRLPDGSLCEEWTLFRENRCAAPQSG